MMSSDEARARGLGAPRALLVALPFILVHVAIIAWGVWGLLQ